MFKGILKGVGKIAGSVVGIVKETSDPASKISSKKSAASVLLFMAGTIAMKSELSGNDIYLITLFTLVGGVLLGLTIFSSKDK